LHEQSILPTWCDSHTHLVFPKYREDEFVDKINGLDYATIAARGGGILNTAAHLAAMSEATLFAISKNRLLEAVSFGTGCIEIKTGYGLNLEGELKMLKVIQKLKDLDLIPIKVTYLAAHALPAEYKNNIDDYVTLIINEYLPKVAALNIADYIDVFCEKGFFTNEHTLQIASAAKKYNLPLKLHAAQLNNNGAVQTGIACKAISVDHLEQITTVEIEALKNSNTIPVALPAAAFFLKLSQAPAKAMWQAGLPVAIATDFNPGSAPSSNMHFSVSLACIQMQLQPMQAIQAATLHGAMAIESQAQYGSIAAGKKASFIITSPNIACNTIPYLFANTIIDQVYLKGKLWNYPS
jgi:imidazolonepropionase